MKPITGKLCKKASENVQVELMFDSSSNNTQKHHFNALENSGGKVYYLLQTNKKGCDRIGIMHHKFCIIDESIIITGSYNWSNIGTRNYENIVVIKQDSELCQKFKMEFDEIKNKYIKDKECTAWIHSPEHLEQVAHQQQRRADQAKANLLAKEARMKNK